VGLAYSVIQDSAVLDNTFPVAKEAMLELARHAQETLLTAIIAVVATAPIREQL